MPGIKKYKHIELSKVKIFTRKRRIISTVLILVGLFLLLANFWPVIKSEIWYYAKETVNQPYIIVNKDDNISTDKERSVFAKFLNHEPVLLFPQNRSFSIVIEKTGVNAPIVANVPITNESAYNEALKLGVAHASSSRFPSENPGNVYLFAHASNNFWQLGKYSTVFNLLRKLVHKDRIHIFYDNKDFIYEVVNKERYRGWNTYPITRPVIEPTLTLQTCDPPGTTLNRLVITAKLVEVQE